ncbi:alpha/beta hydrolase family protein [Streptomyces sp. TLI_171]|uniref:alpha/beta hydrolase n=1 Tax=Streptomyces sp. TLI_171 TaxID=1938859 RepID=UPI000C177CFF|nr:alpha/beta hydrolase-fold protein [Streptomyces sp. TLI_171]RKE19303.1 S-formylglutathione hydrolase FrmB [Streptomyces sp. TLI_171]
MDISLLSGWLPWTLRILAVAAVATALSRVSPFWLRRRLPWVVGGALAGTALIALLVALFGGIDEPLPAGLWFWLCCALLGLGGLAAGVRQSSWWNLAAVPLAVVLSLLCAANSLNISTGYYPDVDAAVGDLSNAPVPQQMGLDEALTTVGRTTAGRVVAVEIPAEPSGFKHRRELVYLPPAWFRSKIRPKLPVVEMIGGQFAAPDNWIRAGEAIKTADAYAAAHNGYAPILVMVDATGNFKTDTECVNGKPGKAEDHLVKDIPPYIARTFNAATGPRSWAVVGWSMGGTCAVDLAVVHPEVFGHFVDISGDAGPNLGGKQATVDQLYGGDLAAWEAHDPATVLGRAKKDAYRNSGGYFLVGDQETGKHLSDAQALDKAARAAGLDTKLEVHPGKHDWQFGTFAFKQALPWLAQRTGLPGATG